MKTSDLDYALPEAQIAQHPCRPRDESRLLVLDRADQSMQMDIYRNVARHLEAGDCMVLNDTRVIRARLFGRKPTGGRVEIFLLHEEAPGVWAALVRPSAKVKPGSRVLLEKPGLSQAVAASRSETPAFPRESPSAAGGETGLSRALPSCASVLVEDLLPKGQRRVRFDQPDVLSLLERLGHIPLPPYIRREDEDSDLRRYQTIYAAHPGAVAAPTAGLHFTERVLTDLDLAGVKRVSLTLHVSYGTFKPITVETLEKHRVDAEEFDFPEATAQALNETRAAGRRVVAVGTTVARVLETQYTGAAYRPRQGITEKYIYPPYAFRAVDVLQTNFHLPRSSLLALVCAFAGTEFVLEAYRFAVREGFRFYSYGDVMLIR